ncbi:phosphate-starvation-inducible PsiE family protein [Thioalkalivibrio sulfidiphilus]|uniref:phosphate-starvation-inducible PsiE family protein n=1 Tax=Thioalkalivibrio sulfidiphilus TaxID=1033854 RepID=UPI00037546F5|nr:phosphate-starvation-inducible PsiE family protein [Thioalkalivibrio sulfidiphilus]
MSFYERFEQAVALTLTGLIAIVIVVSMVQLVRVIFTLLIVDALNPLDHAVFQTVFGAILTLLIAMEFKHSIIRVAMRKESIIQVKTVLLIALLALSRKFIILDPDIDAAKLAALAATVVALGLTYWLLRERDDRVGRSD